MPDLEKGQLSCLICGSTEKLNMYAQRNDVKIVGFILVCEDCFMVVAGKKIVVELREPHSD